MATLAQITANRANAQLSTGPRSAEGKSASRFNALKHGIDAETAVIPGEDPAEYQALTAEYQNRFQPQTPDERYHIQTMIDSDWQKRRLSSLETGLYIVIESDAPGQSLAAAILSQSPAAKLLARVQRQLAAHQRAWYRAFTEFRRQRECEDEVCDFQPDEEFEQRNEPNCDPEDDPEPTPSDPRAPIRTETPIRPDTPIRPASPNPTRDPQSEPRR